MGTIQKDTRKAFLRLGTCSQTYFYTLNKEFGHLKKNQERAADPLAGGIVKEGCQCGMLWGATLAAGAEAYRKYKDKAEATTKAIMAAQHLTESFKKRTNTVDCLDITKTDLTKKFGVIKLLFKARTCISLAGKWSAEAIEAAKKGLNGETIETKQEPISCASEVVRKMGGTEEEIATVAGLAGGIGLSGKGCGALSAAIWKTSLEWCKENQKKSNCPNSVADKMMEKFFIETNGEMECKELCGKTFKSIDEHTEFIKNGGCKELIEALCS